MQGLGTYEALGVDIGGVIYDRMVPVPGAFYSLALLAKLRFGPRVYLISMCGERMEALTRVVLRRDGFHVRTGITPDRLHFCRRRLGPRGKPPIVEQLGITHMVDDRLEILGSLPWVPHRLLLRPRAHEVERHREHLPLVQVAGTWADVRAAILDQAV